MQRKTTLDQLIDVIKEHAPTYVRTDAADRIKIPGMLFSRFSASFSELLSDTDIDNTIAELKKRSDLNLNANHTKLMMAIREHMNINASTNDTLKAWVKNIDKLINAMPVPSNTYFAAKPTAIASSSSSISASSHRQTNSKKP